MSTVLSNIEEICRTGIPGYDAWATAEPGMWFDADAAQLAIDFFMDPDTGCLRHIEGAMAGQLFALEPWQQAIVGNIFGWKRKDKYDRTVRRYREVFIFVARKNGKTPLASGIANYVLFCDQEAGAQCYCAAADRDQAAIVYNHAKGMVEQEQELSSRCQIYKAHKSIVLDDGSFLKVLSADAHTKHGGNSHLVIVDEVHAQPNRDLVDVLQTSMASANRPQPLIVFITTSDYDRPSICNEKHDYASKVRDGIIPDASMLPVIYEASKDDDFTDPAVWKKANPNLDVSVSREYMEREAKRAAESPAYLNTFLRLHLNIKTQTETAWGVIQHWDKGSAPLDMESLKGRTCYAGLDMSSTTDTTCLSLVFPDPDGGSTVLPFFWIPGENAHQRERRDRVPYLMWAREGFIDMTSGNTVDQERIRVRINELGKVYHIRGIAIDRWNTAKITTELQGDGFSVLLFGQGYASMSNPTKYMEKLILDGTLRHGGNPVLRWMASNVMLESDAAENIKPSKDKSTDRIDGIVATIMGLQLALDNRSSIYESRGVFVL